MILSQAGSLSSSVISHILFAVAVCVLIGLVLVLRLGIRGLRKLLLERTGPWRWVGIILLGTVVLVIGAYVGIVVIGVLRLLIS
ncbi:hypothetical protein ACIO3S_28980 [Nocardioides sp. NPDC087217]|uniref:hypothetical protein n=1 Tax=Nocardioides sp. NPDC087217 TaxID=3364335 RepID=UPI003825BD47